MCFQENTAFIDTKRMGIIKKKVRKLEDQLDYESRRWEMKLVFQQCCTLWRDLHPRNSLDCGEMWRWTWSWKTSMLRRKPSTDWRRSREPRPERGRKTRSSGRRGWGGRPVFFFFFISLKMNDWVVEFTGCTWSSLMCWLKMSDDFTVLFIVCVRVFPQLFHEDGECWVYDEPLLKRLAS